MNLKLPMDGLSIEELQARDRPRMAAHFARLSPDDRALRFNSALVDEAGIERYVGRMRFGDDLILGLVDAQGRIVGVAHGCVFEADGVRGIEAAFSIDAAWRGRGFGSALMRALTTVAPQRGVRSMVGLCAVRNLPMRRLFERAGMVLSREDDEIDARLEFAAGAVRSGTATTARVPQAG